jgi:hypothetical protein
MLAALCLTGAGSAPTTLELDARNGPPVIDAVVDGRTVRLEVEPDLAPAIILNRTVAERLGIRPALTRRMTVSLDERTSVRGRLSAARFSLANGMRLQAPVGLFALPVTDAADGVIGLAALPQDVITVRLGPAQPGERRLQAPLNGPRAIFASVQNEDERISIAYRFRTPQSVLDSRATRLLGVFGQLTVQGGLTRYEVVLGLGTRAQPVTSRFQPLGLDLGTTLAETDAPIEGALEPGTVVVLGSRRTPMPPRITLGRNALRACSSLVIDRPGGTLTLSCRVG